MYFYVFREWRTPYFRMQPLVLDRTTKSISILASLVRNLSIVRISQLLAVAIIKPLMAVLLPAKIWGQLSAETSPPFILPSCPYSRYSLKTPSIHTFGQLSSYDPESTLFLVVNCLELFDLIIRSCSCCLAVQVVTVLHVFMSGRKESLKNGKSIF